MTPANGKDKDDARHVGPAGGAYEEEQKGVRERNEQAKQAGKERNAEKDRRAAAARRDEDQRGEIYR
jgi:hypothetical protein